MKIVNPTDIVFPKDLTERTYHIANIKFSIALLVFFQTLPWILWLIIAAILPSDHYPWWVALILVCQIGPILSFAGRKTAKIRLCATDHTVTHYNIFNKVLP